MTHVCSDVRSAVPCEMHVTTDTVLLAHCMVHVSVLTSIFPVYRIHLYFQAGFKKFIGKPPKWIWTQSIWVKDLWQCLDASILPLILTFAKWL